MRVSIEEFLARFNNDVDFAYDKGCYHFYDWFCKDSALPRKALFLVKRLRQIVDTKTNKFDITKTYVFFKNNCPMVGKLYDDFRICDLTSGDVIYTITPKSGHKVDNERAELWGKDNDFKEPIVTGEWQDIINWFKNS